MKGEEIKQKVKQSGKTFAEIARLMGIRPQTLTIIFASDDVKTGSLERIAEAMGVPVAYFYGEGDNVTASNATIVRHGNVGNVNNNSEERSVLVLAEQLSTKDKQIHTKDQQIDRLLGIIEKLSEDGQ